MSGQEKDFRSRISANFSAEMQRIGLPRVVMAARIGVSERQIARWLNGETVPRYRSVVQFAQVFGRAPEWFYLDHSDGEVVTLVEAREASA